MTICVNIGLINTYNHHHTLSTRNDIRELHISISSKIKSTTVININYKMSFKCILNQTSIFLFLWKVPPGNFKQMKRMLKSVDFACVKWFVLCFNKETPFLIKLIFFCLAFWFTFRDRLTIFWKSLWKDWIQGVVNFTIIISPESVTAVLLYTSFFINQIMN